MDYEGQRLAELLFYWIILSFGAVGWIIGYFQQDFFIVFKAWLVGVVISVVVSPLEHLRPRKDESNGTSHNFTPFLFFQLCVPDWPFYNKHPIKWLDSVPDRRQKTS